MSGPRTKAGRELLALLDSTPLRSEAHVDAIVAIEQELLSKVADLVRAVDAAPIRDTDYVPRFKRRPDQCIDRAAVLQAIEELRRG